MDGLLHLQALIHRRSLLLPYFCCLVGYTCICLTPLRAQCPPAINVDAYANARDTDSLLVLSRALEPCPDSAELLALTYHNLGVIYYGSEKFDSAIWATRLAIGLRDSLVPMDFNTGKSHHNLAFFLTKRGQYDEALREFNRAIEIFRHNKHPKAFNSGKQLAWVHYDRGDITDARESMKSALQQATHHLDTTQDNSVKLRTDLADYLLDYSSILIDLENYEAATDTLQVAFELLNAIDGPVDVQMGNFYLNSGVIQDTMGAYTDALKSYQTASDYFIRHQKTHHTLQCWNNMGVVYRKLTDFENALLILNRALSEAILSNNVELQADILDNLGDVYCELGDTRRSLDAYARAIQLYLPDFDDHSKMPFESLRKCPAKVAVLTFLTDRAECLMAEFEINNDPHSLVQCLRHLTLADTLADLMRFEHHSVTSKFFWREKVKPMYALAIRACYLLNDPHRAYYFFEKSKSILLLEAVNLKSAWANLPVKMAERERKLQELVSWARKNSSEKLNTYLSANRVFRDSLSAAYPRYFEFLYTPRIATLAEVQENLLNDGAGMLLFFMGAEQTYRLDVTRNSTNLHVVASTHTLNTLISAVLNNFHNRPTLLKDAGTEDTLHILSTLLLAGLPALDSAHLLYMVPDGSLGNLPFDALVAPDQRPLLYHHAVAQAYSASILRHQQQTGATHNQKFVAFMPFADDASTKYLEGSGIEQRVLQKFSGKILRNREATTGSFVSNSTGAGLIHLSTHASANLTGGPPEIEFHDTLITLTELYGMEFDADLVVLSACETGIGEEFAGEGILSLSYGFTYAGARAIASTLWKVNDASTAFIIDRFYHYLRKNSNPVFALRKAKMDFLADDDSNMAPYYWAGLQYYGPEQEIAFDNAWPYNWTICILLLFFIGYLLIRRKMSLS